MGLGHKDKNKNPVSKRQSKVNNLSCGMCGNVKKVSEFYVSYNPLHTTSRLPYCKQCLQLMCIDSKGNISLDGVYRMLQAIDRPFIYELFKTSAEDRNETIGVYMKNIAMLQYRYLGWKESVFKPQVDEKDIIRNAQFIEDEQSQPSKNKLETFITTDEIMDKWGYGYPTEEYYYFEKKYNLLKNNYSEKTSMHTEALLNYIRYRVKEELATARGDVGEAGKWGDLANKAATAAKINPSQLSKADLSDGLSTFSELSQAVEKEVDIIPILPRFKYRPNDAIDFNIWCYVNYIRDLQGLPPCNYEDVYAFYDRRKEEYIKQYGDPYGIFANDTTEKNREKIKQFIKEDGVQ